MYKFAANAKLFQLVINCLGLTIPQFLDKGLFYLFPVMFFEANPMVDLLIQFKGYDKATFFITNIHLLIGYSLISYDDVEKLEYQMEKALMYVSELSGNKITIYDILKACFQDVLRLIFIELARCTEAGIRSRLIKSLQSISQIILNEKDQNARGMSYLLKKCYLGIFYFLHEEIRASHCIFEKLHLTKALYEMTLFVDSSDLKAYLSHIVPLLEDITEKYGEAEEFSMLLSLFWNALIEICNHDSIGEFLLFLRRCNNDSFLTSFKKFSLVADVQILFFRNFSYPSSQILSVLSTLLSSKFEFVIDFTLDIFYDFFAKDPNSQTIDSHILKETAQLLYQLASNTNIQLKCMKCLSLIGYIEDLTVIQPVHSKPNESFPIDYLDTKTSILESSSIVIAEFLVPNFRSCRELSLQDRFAYVIQELLKITGYSQLITPSREQHLDSLNLTAYESIVLERWKRFPPVVRDNLYPFLKTKYVVNLPDHQSKNPAQLFRSSSFSYKEWTSLFFANVLSRISSDFLVEFFSPFRAIINCDNKIMRYVLGSAILCSLMDPVEYDTNAAYIVGELNNAFKQFSSNILLQNDPSCKKVVIGIFALIESLRLWRFKTISISFKNKKPVSNGNVMALRRVEEVFFSRIDKVSAAACALAIEKYSTALLFIESNNSSVGKNGDFIASQYKNLKASFSSLRATSNLKELIKHYHEDNMDLKIIFELENDWRNCLLLNQRNTKNHVEIDKCLYMLGMDEIVLQKYQNTSSEINEFACRAIINLQKWDLVDLYKNQSSSLQTISNILNDQLTINNVYLQNNFEQTCINASLFHDITNNHQLLSGKRLAMLHFNSYDKLFGFHLLCDRFSQTNLWLERSKFCRKSQLFDLAYASLLKIPNHLASCEVVIERAKIMWHQGYQLQALQELKNNQSHIKFNYHPSTATANASHSDLLKGKILRLTAKWMDELKMDMSGEVLKKIREAIFLDEHSEKGHYMFAKYHFKLYFNQLEKNQGKEDSARFLTIASSALNIIRCFARALLTGSKFIYESMPRMLNVWLDVAAKSHSLYEKVPPEPALADIMSKMEKTIEKTISKLAPWQFFIGLNLIIARLNHSCPVSSDLIQRILLILLQTYPDQTMWFLFSQARSSNSVRKSKFFSVVTKLKTMKFDQEFMARFNQCLSFFETLLHISNYMPTEKQGSSFNLSSVKEFKTMNNRLFPLRWIIPQTDSLVPQLPSDNSCNPLHNPFPTSTADSYITGIKDVVEVLNSLQRPKKISLLSSDGKEFEFLCKPKDDLRTDARVMEFFSLVNKLLLKDKAIRSNHELGGIQIRCYCVLPLNEECGIIEWVPSTICYRVAVNNTYSIKDITLPSRDELVKIFEMKMPLAEIFTQKLLPRYPSVFADWLRYQFIEPNQWYFAKQQYCRTTATMSMVGAMLGLGDRHGENIMLDERSGAVVHVDFNCLFDKGLKFAKPEKVPFRMTHNMENALGILGTKGFFTETCISVLRILRNNRDMLLSNLEAFIHDPIIDFSRKRPSTSPHTNLGASRSPEVEEAVRCITAVGVRLMGHVGDDLPLSVEGQVEELIKNATDIQNLSQMFIGWAAYL